MIKKTLRLAAAGIAALFLLGTAQADTLADIKQKGVLVVGSKADYRPFGFLEARRGDLAPIGPSWAFSPTTGALRRPGSAGRPS